MLYLGTSALFTPGGMGALRYLELPGREHFELYSREFNACELVLPHYLPPRSAPALTPFRHCRPGFLFTVKTHPEMTQRCPGDASLLAAFCQAVEPLWRDRRLGCVVAPFPAYFEYSQRHRDYLLLLKERLGETPLAVEFHNPSWFRRDALDWMHWHRLSLCWGDSTALPLPFPLRATAGMAYIRLRAGILSPASPGGEAFQLSRWLPRIRELTAQSEKTFVLVISSLQGQGLEFLRKLKRVLEGTGVTRPQGTGVLLAGVGGGRR